MNTRGPLTGTRRRSVFTARLVNSAEEGQVPDVAEDLRAAILSGDEPPGTVIPIEAVARFFGVSQIPVREALKVLLGEGLVDHVPHVGYSVAKVTFAEFRELYEVRQALEVAALRLAVQQADDEDDDVVRAAHDRMAVTVAEGDGRGYSAASRGFHLALIRPSRMQRLLHMYEGAWNMTESAQPMTRVQPGGRQLLFDDHDRMLAAFLARDGETLVSHSEQHYGHLKTAIESFQDDASLFRQSDQRRV